MNSANGRVPSRLDLHRRNGPLTVSLVLGSGGARGLAHVGVIRWLEANGFRIVSIAGTSIGALVGGVHAAGRLDAFEQWMRAMTVPTMLALMDFNWGRGGFIRGEKLLGTLAGLVGDRRIEDLPIPFTAVAADLGDGKEVWLRSGSLMSAIRASISLPLLFTPFEHRGMKLIDGGVLNPVPIAPTLGDDSDLTIAVNLAGPAEDATPHPVAVPGAAPENGGFVERIADFVRGIDATRPAPAGTDWGAYDVAYLAFDAMQGTIARQKLAAYPPDRLIEISREAFRSIAFDRAAEIIALGHAKAAEALGDLVPSGDAPPRLPDPSPGAVGGARSA